MIEIKNLSFRYADSQKRVLDNITLDVDDSEFILITGPSGCGKSSLCRCFNGLIPSFYGGEISGFIQVQNLNPIVIPTKNMAKKVGMVFQDPENQLVTNDVEREIAFGMQNMGLSENIIAKRIEEILDTIGINHLRNRQITTLSGGEKQKTAIASVLALHPEILILDEPTSELDPKGAEDVIQLIRRLNEEIGLTIILVEHRIDRVLHYTDRLIVMNKGMITYDGTPREYADEQNQKNIDIGLPPITQLSILLKQKKYKHNTPLTIKEGRKNYQKFFKENQIKKPIQKNHNRFRENKKCIVKTQKLWYKYPQSTVVLKNINLEIFQGEFVTLIGRNATGKTTLAKMLNGLLKPTRGKIEIFGLDTKKTDVENFAKYVGYIFQDPNMHLFADTIEEEITFMMQNLRYPANKIENILDKTLKKFRLQDLRKSYPRSLSTGEKQRVAIASVLSTNPKLLILDEPTRGLDYRLKKDLMNYLVEYRDQGGTIFLISHDMETIARYGERIILLGEGEIIADGDKHQILSNSLHFSPQINRLIQPFKKYGWPSDILTVEEIEKELQ